MRGFLRPLPVILFATLSIFSASSASAGWIEGTFTAGVMPVSEHHCVPATPGPHPAIILLHGAAKHINLRESDFEKICMELAAEGYFTEFIEYFSQTGAVGPERPLTMIEDTPVWLAEIKAGLETIDKNPAVDPHRVAILGFSLGAYLALSAAATDPEQIAAVVEYYGGLPKRLQPRCATMPPVLIIHGEKDSIVPVTQARTLDAVLTKYNRPHEMHLYPDANHAFNFPGVPFWYSAADAQDAWMHTLSFLNRYVKNEGAH
ncbi:MAG TPA: dienelactone hydrolase family protein [Candidatus Binataceae bacterium]|nr:dienelactone hydrolase family protein [Candidatus Binataceae bacterium]